MGIEPYLLPEDNERSDIAAIAFEIIQLSKHAHTSTSVRDSFQGVQETWRMECKNVYVIQVTYLTAFSTGQSCRHLSLEVWWQLC